ncbi:MAG: DUF5320 domain-containing protein [Pirellulaceae bacterium]|jgi:hypothetical protein|nr:DUF5320 domain-containing protein [Pirellulaceae bacterium]
MTGRDGTGPTGAGPMTGRGLGDCASADADAYRPRAEGAARGGRGRGRGRRRRQRWAVPGARGGAVTGATDPAAEPTPSPVGGEPPSSELDTLKSRLDETAAVLEQIRARLGQLEHGAGA